MEPRQQSDRPTLAAQAGSGASHTVAAGHLYLLAYTDDDVQEHAQLAATRKRQIKAHTRFNARKDEIHVFKVRNLGTLKGDVERVVKAAQKKGLTTAEFAMWSHAALDGPIAPEATTRPKPIKGVANQLSIDEWMAIDFNWDRVVSFAAFYGCRSALERTGAKAAARSFALNFLKARWAKGYPLTATAGQPWFTTPSTSYKRRRSPGLTTPKKASLWSVAALSMMQEDGRREYSLDSLERAYDARTSKGAEAIKMRLYYRKVVSSETRARATKLAYGTLRHWPNISMDSMSSIALKRFAK
ncbi:MAG: hypothetical protein AAF970_15885 [Bacteroidota bacterium]